MHSHRFSTLTFCLVLRGKDELELDFRRFWEEFRSSSSEKEKERALNLAVDVFCRLVKQHSSIAQLVTKLVEAHVFSFVIGRAFVTDVEKLRIHSKGRALRVADVIGFFSDITELGICPGSNLLYAVEVLVTEVSEIFQAKFDPNMFYVHLHSVSLLCGVKSIR
ncbi:hypothetical protein PR202_ga13426 [Eleusine coracana subsp. coracana]|uniref:Uncharacterized protein n=1 Tax=Eleusine coracana subsp. coracana TaxID=191504 RepID=A0AAV5CE89_ELECO|nr:hypothetical protein PR202_ga13426 [Eleusine coracana subsp. coracana]